MASRQTKPGCANPRCLLHGHISQIMHKQNSEEKCWRVLQCMFNTGFVRIIDHNYTPEEVTHLWAVANGD